MEYLQKGNVYALPAIHYNMEMAGIACKLFQQINPDCVAVELAEGMQEQFVQAASRLPDLTILSRETKMGEALFYLMEPCDPVFEALRSALEKGIDAFCIDLDLDDYPMVREAIPDPYAITKIGFEKYYSLSKEGPRRVLELDKQRELHMAKRLKELSLRYEKVFFVGGMHHVEAVLSHLDQTAFPKQSSLEKPMALLSSPTVESQREIQAECGFFSLLYEEAREAYLSKEKTHFPPDRQKAILSLFKKAADAYKTDRGAHFPGYHLRNLMKFARNYALKTDRLLPDLFQIIAAAKGCVDHDYAYEVWKLATEYPYLKNVDDLPELSISVEDLWGEEKKILFHLKQKSKKLMQGFAKRSDKSKAKIYPPSPFSICSYPPEDVVIEKFGDFLKKKGIALLSEEGAKTVPFSSSLEDGVDAKETIRHFGEKKLYVKVNAKPPGEVGSVVVIFEEDSPKEGERFEEKFPWLTTWIGEHNQESDMAFYATSMKDNVVGPGISKCLYGGFLMSYPPRRLFDIWHDPDYIDCRSKSEVLLMAAIDYAAKPLIVYVAAKPPRSAFKSAASRFGKKILYIPIGQLSPVTLNRLRNFHVLDGHDKREIAGDFIF